MYLTPAHQLLLRKARPDVRLLDVRSDTTALTTYTFTNVNVPANAAANSRQQTYGTDQVMRSPSTKAIIVIVHSEDDAITFGVTSVTIGGVAGNEIADRGGATVAINTAIYSFPAAALASVTNTDIVVTHTEAVTGCAIGVLEIENILFAGSNFAGGTNVSSAGTGVSTGPVLSLANATGTNMATICGTTCVTGGGAEAFLMGDVLSTNAGLGHWPPIWLYDQSNANFAYAACWYWVPGYPGGQNLGRANVDWSGTGAFDMVVAAIA